MIRPSLLQIAEKCGLAPALAERYPESGAAADRGKAIHAEIARCAKTGGLVETREARSALAMLLETHGDISVEVPVELRDPEDGTIITGGTADVVIDHGRTGGVSVWDWKTGLPDYVTPAADNLQLHAYALAVAIGRGRESYTTQAVFLSEDGALAESAPATVTGAEMWTMLERIKRAAAREPSATPGEHCGGCYQRHVCPSYRERVSTALTLLSAPAEVAVNDETAAALIARVKSVREACDVAESIARAHVRGGGVIEVDGRRYLPTASQGRRSASVAELDAAGLGRYVKQGAAYETWKWRRA